MSTFRLAIFFAPEAIGFGIDNVDAAGMADDMVSLALPKNDLMLSKKAIC